MAKKNDDNETLPNAFSDEPKAKIEPKVADEPKSAAVRLRAYEDEVLGHDAVRIGDELERGHGSAYAKMSDEQRAKYEALERLVVAEQRLADAHAALIAADADYEAAEAAVK